MTDLSNKAEVYEKLQDPKTCRDTFSQIIRKYQKGIYWHVRKMVIVHDDADDILQNTFIKAWTNILKFRGDSSISTWLYRIATNETIDFLQSAYKRNTAQSVDYQDYMAGHLDKDPYFDGDAAQKKLQKAILQLPDKQRIVFNMRYYDEMPYAEMSEILETSEGALKASYHFAEKKVKEYLLAENN